MSVDCTLEVGAQKTLSEFVYPHSLARRGQAALEDIGMLKRYAIIDDQTLKLGVAKLAAHVVQQSEARASKKVVAICG
jgi:hypothetical protein